VCIYDKPCILCSVDQSNICFEYVSLTKNAKALFCILEFNPTFLIISDDVISLFWAIISGPKTELFNYEPYI